MIFDLQTFKVKSTYDASLFHLSTTQLCPSYCLFKLACPSTTLHSPDCQIGRPKSSSRPAAHFKNGLHVCQSRVRAKNEVSENMEKSGGKTTYGLHDEWAKRQDMLCVIEGEDKGPILRRQTQYGVVGLSNASEGSASIINLENCVFRVCGGEGCQRV